MNIENYNFCTCWPSGLALQLVCSISSSLGSSWIDWLYHGWSLMEAHLIQTHRQYKQNPPASTNLSRQHTSLHSQRPASCPPPPPSFSLVNPQILTSPSQLTQISIKMPLQAIKAIPSVIFVLGNTRVQHWKTVRKTSSSAQAGL